MKTSNTFYPNFLEPVAADQIARHLHDAEALRAQVVASLFKRLGERIRAGLRRAQERLAQRHARHAAYAELMSLDDRTLRDIGISRSDIEAVVNGSLQRQRPETAANENGGFALPVANSNLPRSAA